MSPPKINPMTVVDSVGDSVVSVLGIFPTIAENIARNATNYAGAVRNDLESIKREMPKNPLIIPKVAVGIIGQTLGAGIGMFEAVTSGVDKTFKDVKAQTRRLTG